MRHAVLDVKSDCFVRHYESSLDDPKSRATREKITCAGMRRMRAFSVVFTSGATH